MLKKSLAVVTAAALTLGALAPAGAQPGRFNDRFDRNDRFNDRLEQAYRDGYRNGFNEARDRRRFDDRYVVAGPPPDRDARWRQRYTQTYTYNDDSFYRECRQSVDPRVHPQRRRHGGSHPPGSGERCRSVPHQTVRPHRVPRPDRRCDLLRRARTHLALDEPAATQSGGGSVTDTLRASVRQDHAP